jgi:hypothetical protein
MIDGILDRLLVYTSTWTALTAPMLRDEAALTPAFMFQQ